MSIPSPQTRSASPPTLSILGIFSKKASPPQKKSGGNLHETLHGKPGIGGLSTKRYPALDVAFSPPQRGGVRFCFTRRDALVASGKFRLIIHANAAGTTGVPLQPLERPACQVRLSEGPACRVRNSEGRACRVRCARLGHPSRFIGHDRRAPPNLMHTPPLSASHQLCRDVAQKALAPDLVLLTHFSSPINFPLPSGKGRRQSVLPTHSGGPPRVVSSARASITM